jgi:nesprin-1
MIAMKQDAIGNLNRTIESGEKLFGSTAPEGREGIRLQLQDLQASIESLFDQLAKIERDLQAKLLRWSGYEESSSAFTRWLQEVEEQLKGKLILKTTLDEKKAQLQTYRTLLQDIRSQKPVLDDLMEKSKCLPEKSDRVEDFVNSVVRRHEEILKKAQHSVEEYEAIVNNHYQYTKAVIDSSEWLIATANTVEMWGDSTLERLNLHANLERLKNLQISLPSEENKIVHLKVCGEKVLPGTLDSGQINIRTQIDSTSQEWQGLIASIQATIETLELKIKQWQEFEIMKEKCLAWLRETDNKLHSFDLKTSFEEKSQQYEALKELQGIVKAKELEIDAVTERAQLLYKEHSTRNTQLTELSVKYQNISCKIKDLTFKWQQYVGAHREYEEKFLSCQNWINEIAQRLAKVQDLNMLSSEEINAKVSVLNELMLSKDEGYQKVQNLVELSQNVLANTSQSGHGKICCEMEKLQKCWSEFVSNLGESRVAVDDSVSQCSGFIEQINQLKQTCQILSKAFKEAAPIKAQSNEKRAQIDQLRNIDEKIRVEKIEVDNLRARANLMTSGHQKKFAVEAFAVLNTFDQLESDLKHLLNERELQFRDHKAFRAAQENLAQYIQRCKDKIHTMRQRSPNDKNFVEAVTQALDHLINKEAQGQILAEQLQQSGDVLASVTAEPGKSGIKKEVIAMVESFNLLFGDIRKQREQMNKVMNVFREYKEETEKLSDWLQQADINIKATKTSLFSNIEEKEKAVKDMNDLNKRLIAGKKDIDKYSEMAMQMKGTCLEANITLQLKEIINKYQMTCSLASDILKKCELIYDQHYEFEQNAKKTKTWIDSAWKVIRGNLNSEGKSKEDLHGQLDRIRQLILDQEEGQKYLHAAIDWSEKACRNTRSDGKEKINSTIKELQAEWEKLLKKMSTAKVTIETDLLQWSDAQQNMSKLQEWITDRESRLQQVSQQRTVMITRRSTLGITTLSVSERQATLRRTNSILQDIQAFEPMIQTVASSAQNNKAPVSEITSKYENLSRQAQEMYDKEKDMVEKHELFMDAGNEFMTWLKLSQEKLDKCSEATGDKESLAGKSSQLKVLEADNKSGELKLENALRAAAEACKIAWEDDQIIIEEEVAYLQDEYDQYCEDLRRCKDLLEGGIVKWTDYQELYQEALEWIDKTEVAVKSYSKVKRNAEEKRIFLEEFQIKLQSIFDWQKELDNLNRKGQTLLENCADSRVSNAITQVTTKYQALLSLAKEAVRRLEVHFQEHHQFNILCNDFTSYVNNIRTLIAEKKCAQNTHSDLSEKLSSLKDVRTSLEQGHNKLRVIQDLKERTAFNTDSGGASEINQKVESLKHDFEMLSVEVQEAKNNLSLRFDLLGDLEKSNKLVAEWIEETEKKLSSDSGQMNDLGEKKANLEKYKTILKDIATYDSIVDKLNAKIRDHPNIPNYEYSTTIEQFTNLRRKVETMVNVLNDQVQIHESYRESYNEAVEYIRKIKLNLQEYATPDGDRNDTERKEIILSKIIDDFPDGDNLLRNVARYCTSAVETSGEEGKECIKQEEYQLRYEWDQTRNQARQYLKIFKKCLESWSEFESIETSVTAWITNFREKLETEQKINHRSMEDLERARELLNSANKEKYNLESMNDKCEILMELSGRSEIRDRTINSQAAFTNLYTAIQELVSQGELSLSVQTDFIRAKQDFDEWFIIALGTVQDSSNSYGTSQEVKQRTDLIKSVASRLTEGQHLLNCVIESCAKVSPALGELQEATMGNEIASMKVKFGKLGAQINEQLSSMSAAVHRWEMYDAAVNEITLWLRDSQSSINDMTNCNGQLSEMKTALQRYKYIIEETKKKEDLLKSIRPEATELSEKSGDDAILIQYFSLEENLAKFHEECLSLRRAIEKEAEDYNTYHQQMQETEKWLLQISFQLMAHNSLYITSREQTQQQLQEHKNLLAQIQEYQSSLDRVREMGNVQIARNAFYYLISQII